MSSDVLVNYPGYGSLWLSDAWILTNEQGEFVVGTAGKLDAVMNFPVSCIRMVVGEPVLRRYGRGSQ